MCCAAAGSVRIRLSNSPRARLAPFARAPPCLAASDVHDAAFKGGISGARVAGTDSSIETAGRRGRVLLRPVPLAALIAALTCAASIASPARATDASGEDGEAPKQPNIYLDLNTTYITVPPNTLALGFRNFTLPIGAAGQSVLVNAPLTVDINDRLSVYAGVGANMSRSDLTSWSAMTLDSWHVGFNADIIKQAEGPGPTLTVISTLTRSLNSPPGLAATSNQTTLELDYALDQDQMQGFLAGTRVTAAWVDSALVKVDPAFVGYIGGYYQWDSNWKVSSRLGVQSFGGARIGNVVLAKAFTQPTLRFDLDKMDDNDNRLFGASIEVAWTPQPIVQMTLRTPLYALRN